MIIGKVCYLALQNPCNARCPMCLSWRDDSMLPQDRVLGLIQELAAQNWETIMFTGGEFVTLPGIADIVTLIREVGLGVGFITNGTALTTQYAGLLDKLAVRKVVLSRDFPDSERHARWRDLPVFDDRELSAVLGRLAEAGAHVQVNTVLMPSNSDLLARFPQIYFWPVVDTWHLIPIKGPIARGWTEHGRERVRLTLEHMEGELTCNVVGPAFFAAPIDDVRQSRPTERVVRGRTCQVEWSQIYVDASGSVLPCNSIAWEHRAVVGFGNLNTNSPQEILRERARALAANHNAARTGCHACDPLNLHLNEISAARLVS
jgi:radical SAM protein with 4Fe4S-binding SPASM domain